MEHEKENVIENEETPEYLNYKKSQMKLLYKQAYNTVYNELKEEELREKRKKLVKCDDCNKLYQIYNLKKHMTRKSHLKNVELNQEKGIENVQLDVDIDE